MNDSLYELMLNAIRSEQANIYTAMPAKVISFNGHTVTCEIMINRIDEKGNDLVIPPLVDVPVLRYRCWLVQIQSRFKEYSGDFKIQSIRHAGDILADDWFSNLLCVSGEFKNE